MKKATNTNADGITDGPYQDMFEAGLKLPERQRAMLAQHYYQRVHLRILGLRLAASCQFHILKQVFGESAEIIMQQAEGELRDSDDHDGRSKITLA